MKLLALAVALAAGQADALQRATTAWAYNAGFKTSTQWGVTVDSPHKFADDTSSTRPSTWPVMYGLETSQNYGGTGTATTKQAESVTWKFTCAADSVETIRLRVNGADGQSDSFIVRMTPGWERDFHIVRDSSWQDVTRDVPQQAWTMPVKAGEQNYFTVYPRETGAVVYAIEVPSGCDVVDYSDGQFDDLSVQSLTGLTENITYIRGGVGNPSQKQHEFHSNSIAADACEHYGLVLATKAQLVGHKKCSWGFVADDVENLVLWMPEDNTDRCQGRAGLTSTQLNSAGGAYCYGRNLAPAPDAQQESNGGVLTYLAGDTVYKCIGSVCRKNIASDRSAWILVLETDTDYPGENLLNDNSTLTTSDGVFTVSVDKIDFVGGDATYEWVHSCSCD